MPLEPRTTQQRLGPHPASELATEVSLVLDGYCSSSYILDSRAVADMGAAAAESLPLSITTLISRPTVWLGNPSTDAIFEISTTTLQA